MFTSIAPAQLARQASRNDHRLAIAQANLATLSPRQLKRRLAKRPAPGIRVAVAVFGAVGVAVLALVVGTGLGSIAELTGAAGGLLTILGTVTGCIINR